MLIPVGSRYVSLTKLTLSVCVFRAQKRMDGERVFGSQITVGNPVVIQDHKFNKEMSPQKGFNNSKFVFYSYQHLPSSLHNIAISEGPI